MRRRLPLPAGDSFYDVLTAAVNDLGEHGFDKVQRVAYWTEQLRQAAARSTHSAQYLEEMLRNALGAIYRRLAERGEVLKRHPGVGRFTLDRVRPELRAELDRRILAAANLIRLNRDEAIQKTLHRFQGWATSIPDGGSDAIERLKVKGELAKSVRGLPFAERRVLIDQGHKLTASINRTVAEGGGAIALVWHSHWRQPGYNYREDHKERDEHVYLLRDSWARERGLVRPGPAGYYDEVTAVGEEPFCRCFATYLYHLRQLPEEMLTVKGRDTLAKVRVA